jgi:quinol monooxygenase YgiN
MLYVIAAIEVVPDKLQEFLPELRKIVPLVRAEQGCLWYEPTVDVPTNISARDAVRENVVTVVERWESIEDLEKHLIAPHMLDYRARVKPLVVGTKLQILAPA